MDGRGKKESDVASLLLENGVGYDSSLRLRVSGLKSHTIDALQLVLPSGVV